MEDNLVTSADGLFQKIIAYLKTILELVRLNALDKLAGIITTLISSIIFFIIGLMLIIMLSFGLAFWVGTYLQSFFWGFLVLAGCYIILGILMKLFIIKGIKKAVTNSIIRYALT